MIASSTPIDGLKRVSRMSVERRCLPIASWPEGDRLAWEAGTRSAGLFEERKAGADWSPRSRQKTARGYGRWLFWMMESGLLDPTLTPGARVTKPLVADYVVTLSAAGAPYTVVCRLQELYDALRVLAPEADWRWLAELWMRLGRRAEPVVNKRLRLRPSRDLVDLGRRMMISAEQEVGWSDRRRAVHYRDGLMIALMAYRPLRLKNFASIVLGVHLVQQSGGWWLQFPACGMKAKHPYEVAFPAALLPELEHYLAIHRKVLLAGESGQLNPRTDALWVSEVGTMLEIGALANRIRKHTSGAFGASLPPHWFRDAAATSIAVEDPRHVGDAHHVLGNTLAMTEKYYNQARSLEASRRHHAMLAALRSSLNGRRQET
jgi:integrase/recombinase XerD